MSFIKLIKDLLLITFIIRYSRDICNCKRNNKDYCEEITNLFKLTKNNILKDTEKARKTYEVNF